MEIDWEMYMACTLHRHRIPSEIPDGRRYATCGNHLDAVSLLKPHLMHRHAVQTHAREWATPCSQRTAPSNKRVFAALVCGVVLGRLLARR